MLGPVILCLSIGGSAITRLAGGRRPVFRQIMLAARYCGYRMVCAARLVESAFKGHAGKLQPN